MFVWLSLKVLLFTPGLSPVPGEGHLVKTVSTVFRVLMRSGWLQQPVQTREIFAQFLLGHAFD